jgi:hypothetical protein
VAKIIRAWRSGAHAVVPASVSHRMMLLAKSSPLGGDESAVRAGTKSKGNGPMINTKLIVQYVMPLSTRFRIVMMY